MRAFLLMAGIAGMFFSAACTKENSNLSYGQQRTDFFTSVTDMRQQVQAVLSRYDRREQLEKIEAISYVDGRNKSYAFVFYQSNRGKRNLVFEHQYLGQKLTAVKSIKCEGENCDCKVLTVISDSGNVSVSCSCTSCTMLVN